MSALRRFPVALLPALALLAVLAWWTLADGGYAPTVWLPGGLLALGLGVVAAVGPAPAGRLPRSGMVAAGALAAFTAWSALSIAWAQAPGIAYEGTLRTAVYAALFLVALTLPWSRAAVQTGLIGYVLLVGVLGLVALLVAAGAAPEDTGKYFLQGRLAWPLAYQNADAAMWTMAAVAGLVLGAREATPTFARPLLTGAASLLLSLALLSESRGWLFSLPLIAGALLVAGPRRMRLALFCLPALCGVALAAGPALDVYSAYGLAYRPDLPGLVAAMDDAVPRIVLGAVLATVLAAGLVLADLRVSLSAAAVERARRITRHVSIAVAIGAITALLVAAHGDPFGKAGDAWDSFKENRTEEIGDSHFGSLGSSRYDFWRVALNSVADHPLGGIGQDNFAETYLAERRNPDEEPRWTHSIELRLLVHTGIAGFLLFAVFAGAALWAALRRPAAGRGLAVAAAAPFLVWLLHGSVDWLWEYPALTGVAVVALAASVALSRTPGAPVLAGRGPRIAAALVAVAVAVPVGMAFVGARLLDRAGDEWPADAERAYRDLDRSAGLQPLSARPDLTAGLIALTRGEVERSRANFSAALDRDSGDWLAWFLAGVAASEAGDEPAATRSFAEAVERNPRGEIPRIAHERSRSGKVVTFAWAQRAFRTRLTERFGSARVDAG